MRPATDRDRLVGMVARHVDRNGTLSARDWVFVLGEVARLPVIVARDRFNALVFDVEDECTMHFCEIVPVSGPDVRMCRPVSGHVV